MPVHTKPFSFDENYVEELFGEYTIKFVIIDAWFNLVDSIYWHHQW